jgi:integrase
MTITQREWKIPGQRTKRLAWGYTITVNGKRTKSFRAEWSKDDAKEAEAKALLKIEAPKPQAEGIRLSEAAERYLVTRTNHGNPRSKEDRRIVEHFKSVFGADTPLAQITASRISAYKAERLNSICANTERPLTAAAVNRPLALLRHLLRLAHDEWEVLAAVPRIKLEREAQGRIRWLEPDEEARLLAACAESQNKQLAAIVTVAMETGLRLGELLGLTWDRVDLTRGVLRLEVTKSGRRREVPMRQVVYNVLSQLPGAHEGRVWRAGSIRTAFVNAVTEAKLDGGLHFHDLRHHFASWFVMRGGQLPALQQILGHATLAMTMRYSHLSPKHLRDEVSKTEAGPARAQGRAHEPSQAAWVSGNIA